jgi:hypothetical protein
MKDYDGPDMCNELDRGELANSMGGEDPVIRPPLPMMPSGPTVTPPGNPPHPEAAGGALAAAALGALGGVNPYSSGGPDPCL